MSLTVYCTSFKCIIVLYVYSLKNKSISYLLIIPSYLESPPAYYKSYCSTFNNIS